LFPNEMCLSQAGYLRCHEDRCFIDDLHNLAYFFRDEEELIPYYSTISLLLQVI
jgi:hypothetical protein